MSSEAEIIVSGVGKTFRTFRHPAQRLAAMFSSRFAGVPVDALTGIDFVARTGECIGIVGRNGAGKSTLLQIVAGVMTPTTGTVRTRGRIAAMLQLGAGFNREFTGRQNVWLSAAIYGLEAHEIEARMESIEAFAGIGAKIDRPVREYSSGTFARLAFAVCAHVDPDILVVDEILGIGDADFQQRSMRFLRQFRRRGIVLFVSHDEHAVSALCSRSIWIDAGRIVADGPSRDVLRRYRKHMAALAATPAHIPIHADRETLPAPTLLSTPPREPSFDPDNPPAPAGGGTINEPELMIDGVPRSTFAGGEAIQLRVSAIAHGADLPEVAILAFVRNPMGQVVFDLDSRRLGSRPLQASRGQGIEVEFRFQLPFLPTGFYAIDVLLLSSRAGDDTIEMSREGAAAMRIVSAHVSGGLANIRMDGVSFERIEAGVPA